MPQSLLLSTPPPVAPFKRQRSRGGETQSRPGSAMDQARSAAAIAASVVHRAQGPIQMPAYLDKSKSEICQLFLDLEWQQRFRLSHALNNPRDSPFRVDRSLTVIDRNRYGNVQPWDASRIRLKTPIGGSDYVNASPISLKSRVSTPSSTRSDPESSTNTTLEQPESSATVNLAENKYIATQGPKEGQFSYFWHMVMQEVVGDVGVVVMLTQCYEGNKEKCSQYFPLDMENPTIPLAIPEDGEGDNRKAPTGPRSGAGISDDGDPFMDSDPSSAETDSNSDPRSEAPSETENSDLKSTGQNGDNAIPPPSQQTDSVTLLTLDLDPSTACEVRHLRLTIGAQTKEIYHYLFNGWPDFGKPEAEDRRALVELLRVSCERAGGAESGNPRFVHCSAGVGRTGTFIALDFLIGEIRAGRIGTSQLQPQLASTPADPDPITANGGTGNENEKQQEKFETWGRSGPTKTKPREATPDPVMRGESGDLVYETVNTLREQRMMMVMNELQFGFIYEVVREVFIEIYGDKEGGVGIRGTGGVLEEPSSKMPRIEGVDTATKFDQAEGTEEESVSEAETEIVDDEEHAQSQQWVDGGVAEAEHAAREDITPSAAYREQGTEKDPYDVVAPESIRQGMEREL